MRRGDMIVVKEDCGGGMVKGWNTCPEDYGCHKRNWLRAGQIGIVLDDRELTLRILVEGKVLWVQRTDLKLRF